MATTNPNWDTSWTTTSISAATITNGSSSTTAAISNDNKIATEISVTVTYGGTASKGLEVYVLGDVDGTNYEAVADGPWGIEMKKSTSTTYRARFMVSALDYSSFKVHLVNGTGASVTAVTVRYRQATFDTV